MSEHNDVVIAGAGVIGLAAAWALCRQGARVTVLDAGTPGWQASWAGGGILWPLYPWRYSEAVRALAARGAALYPALCEDLAVRTGIDPEWRRTGMVMLDGAERDAAIDWARMEGWRSEVLPPEVLASRLPGVCADEGGVYLPEVAQVRNPRLCRALVVALRLQGARVIADTPVTGVASRGGRFSGFHTAAGRVDGDAGVVAAGPWSSAIAGFPALPAVSPIKGQMLLLSGRPGLLPHMLLQRGRYAIPRADGRVLIGSTVESAGFDTELTTAARDQLAAAAAGMAPALADLPVAGHWTGLRPATADGEPFVGAVPDLPGLYASIGHYRNGLANAPAAAERLAALIDAPATTPAV